VGIWIVALFLAGVAGTKGAPTGTSVLLLAGWAGTLVERAPHVAQARRHARWALGASALLLIWSAMSLVWATDSSVGFDTLRSWIVAVAVLPVLVTTCQTPRDAMVVAGAFVAGACLAVVTGLVLGSTSAPDDPIAAAGTAQGRLMVGITDPNYLAADIVAALAIVVGLLGVRQLRSWRPALLLAVPILLYGLVATQSRGGIIAAAVLAVLAPAMLRQYRGRLVAATLLAVVLVGAFLVAQPRALDRLTQQDATGTGRTDIWSVALAVARDHPVLGVGTGNFIVVESDYARAAGTLVRPDLIVDTPLVTHDIWLQATVENGLIGLALMVAALGACVGSALAAARRFAARGEHDLAHLARALAVGQIGGIVASTFIANGDDRVFWVLLSLGPVLLVLSRLGSPERRAAA
jgi:O-antigen ligase